MNSTVSTIIKNYEFSTIIGLLEHERNTPQNIKISIKYKSHEFIDYISILEFIKDCFNKHKFKTVEDALKITSKELKESFKSLLSIKFKVLKKEVLQVGYVGAEIKVIF